MDHDDFPSQDPAMPEIVSAQKVKKAILSFISVVIITYWIASQFYPLY